MVKNRLIFSLSFFVLGMVASSCKPRCPIASCQVRMEHIHGDTEYRGQPFWKKQNPKMGEKLPKASQEKQHGNRR